ncbi:hypothetical protein DZ860_00475 [Vibrio sinensis]|uniref:Hydroxyacid dehydrogenase n=1 Tax=Vibrio sinensis TaxID=2302434 RepID=A0A3A6R248_9VIBR|nr:NAD(P)-dependent oxidoreductase [Vibrio sinensis]RJX75197.1 hypothetical protein DZ860_00475 [Vibrio sinensis]
MEKALLTCKLDQEAVNKLKTIFDVTVAGAALSGDDELPEAQLEQLVTLHQPHVLIVDSSPTTKAVLAASTALKLVICARGTPNNVDVEYCKAHNIDVCNTPSRNANAVAEFTLGLILGITRSIPQSMAAITSREITLPESELSFNTKDVTWQHTSLPFIPYEKYKAFELAEATLGLIGLGAIGLAVAEKAKALSMNVKVYDPYVDPSKVRDMGLELVEFDELIATSDVISIHAKETDATQNMINADVFSAMKPSAYFINTARASLVNYDDLLKALTSRTIEGAAVDVFPIEPLGHENALIDLPNLILTPHIGGASRNVVSHHTRMVMVSIDQYLRGLPKQYSCIR